MHFSAGILAGGRANLMAVEKGSSRRRKRAVGNMGRHEDGMGQVVIGKVYCHTLLRLIIQPTRVCSVPFGFGHQRFTQK